MRRAALIGLVVVLAAGGALAGYVIAEPDAAAPARHRAAEPAQPQRSARAGYREGFRKGLRNSYAKAYDRAYVHAYQQAFADAGLAVPGRVTP